MEKYFVIIKDIGNERIRMGLVRSENLSFQFKKVEMDDAIVQGVRYIGVPPLLKPWK